MVSATLIQSSVTTNYEQYLGPLFFEPYALVFAEKLQTLKASKMLELACGTGRLTRHLLLGLPKGGELYATDLSQDMLSIAKDKIDDDRIHWQLVDAQELPYEDQVFDAVVCQFGVMFFPDKLKAFKEAFRVLQPGGTFAFLTWDHVAQNALANETLCVLQTIFPEHPPSFVYKGPYSYFEGSQIACSLQEAGFQQVEIAQVALTGTVGNVEDAITGFLNGSPLASYLLERGTTTERVSSLLRNPLSSYHKNGTFHFPMQALYCHGIK